MGLLAVFHYKPEGAVAEIIVFVGAYVLTKLLSELLWSTLPIWLIVLSALIYMYTLNIALQGSIPGVVLTMFLPAIAQAYWIWALWAATGTLFHPLTILCVAWLILLGIWIFAQDIIANWCRPRSKLRRCGD